MVLIGELSIVCTIVTHVPSLKQKIASAEGYILAPPLCDPPNIHFLIFLFRDDMINELWHRCLFPEPDPLVRHSKLRWRESNKCKTMKSRAMCFKLLTQLASGCQDNLHTILHLLLPNHQTGTFPPPFPVMCHIRQPNTNELKFKQTSRNWGANLGRTCRQERLRVWFFILHFQLIV